MNSSRIRWSILAPVVLVLCACAEDPMSSVLAEAEQSKARDWSHLAGLPEPQSVLMRVGHGDPLVAVVRQCQVLTKLHELLADDPLFAPADLGSLPHDGVRLRDGYRELMEGDLYRRFAELRASGGDPRAAWREACEGTAEQWRQQSITDEDWLATLVPPSRAVAERQLAVYAKAVPAAARAKAGEQTERVARRQRERLLVMGIGLVVTLLGLLIMRAGWRIQRTLDKYEFEHRNAAGVVEFESHEAALRHRRRKYGANQFLYLGGALVAIVGVVVFLARLGG